MNAKIEVESRNAPSHFLPDWHEREHFRQLLESAPVAIVTVDEAGYIRYANAKLEETFGYARDELLGQSVELLIPERFHGDHANHRARYVQTPHARPMGSGLDLAGRRKNGEEFAIEVGLSHMEINGVPRVMASIVDITRRKETEELLERRVAERTREIEQRRLVSDGLRDILAILNSNRTADEILEYIVGRAQKLLHAAGAAVYHMDEIDSSLKLQASVGLQRAETQAATPARLETSSADDGRRDGPTQGWNVMIASTGQEQLENPILDVDFQAILTAPIMVKDETYGTLMLYYDEPRRFSAEEIQLAVTVADQAALAIENARLRTQVERSAVAAERSRIARDLHDSVTQTLFSASIIAEVLPRLWGRDNDESMRRLDELRQLTRGALAEMRTLLLELRPATLIEVELTDLLRQLTEAIMGRARVPITLEIEGDEESSPSRELPADVKVALYHIAQEALNNVAKHARASHATVRLERNTEEATLVISDDGRGFHLDRVTPSHLGLTIMRERADAIGATLEIRSKVGEGSYVGVAWSPQQVKSSDAA